jgi:hypothetical protein
LLFWPLLKLQSIDHKETELLVANPETSLLAGADGRKRFTCLKRNSFFLRSRAWRPGAIHIAIKSVIALRRTLFARFVTGLRRTVH